MAGPLKASGAAARRTAEVGDTGALVSRLALGGGPLGNLLRQVTDEDAERVVLAAHHAGIRLFDTAPVYGLGLAEQRLGRALRSVDRDDVTVSTKVGRLLRADAPREEALFDNGVPFFRGAPDLGTVWDFSYDGARRSLEESLERLGLAHADIVYLHEPSPERAEWAATDGYRALRDLRAAGSVRAIGLGSDLIEVMVPMVRELQLDCLLLASRYSLLDHSALDELLPLCVERGVAVIMGGVFNSGILADPDATPTFDYVPADADMRARVGRLRAVCDSWNVPLKAAALQFPLLHPAAISVVVGMRTESELRDNIEMLEVEIPAGLWRELKRETLIPEAAPTDARG